MKIVFSSTVEQEQEIENLISKFYYSVFPKFFSEDEIQHFQEIGVLRANKNDFSYNGTLRAAFQVITCLQVMISVLEKKVENHSSSFQLRLKQTFEQNNTLLNQYGIFFPFNYEHFTYISNGNHEKMDNDVFAACESIFNMMISKKRTDVNTKEESSFYLRQFFLFFGDPS